MTSAELVIQNIKNHPEEWESGQYTAVNTKRGLSIWTSNGAFSCRPYAVSGQDVFHFKTWNWRERRKVWKALHNIPEHFIQKALNQ